MTNETNPLIDPDSYYAPEKEWAHMTLRELSARGGKITRVRWLGERVFGGTIWDLSYVHGSLGDGTPVRIEGLPAAHLIPGNKRGAALIEWAREEGVFAKGLGLLDAGNWSSLC